MNTYLANWYWFGCIPVCKKGNWMPYDADSEIEARIQACQSLRPWAAFCVCLGLLKIKIVEKKPGNQ